MAKAKKKPAPPPAVNVCPFCKGQLQATVKVDCDLDDDGLIVMGNQGDFRIYCENDCEEWEDYSASDYSAWPTIEDVTTYLEQVVVPIPGEKPEESS
jgi:hypothetical protein